MEEKRERKKIVFSIEILNIRAPDIIIKQWMQRIRNLNDNPFRRRKKVLQAIHKNLQSFLNLFFLVIVLTSFKGTLNEINLVPGICLPILVYAFHLKKAICVLYSLLMD